ncbi:MAG: DNA-binding protein [Tissierellia bacterium]|nr:DNA-binding protein [Tissierellia bacterium]
MFEKFDEINRLLDFYGGLLSNIQLECMNLYYRFDYTLSEIAEEYSISRQAVSENIKRAEQKLYGYEEALNLADRFYKREEALDNAIKRLDKLINSIEDKKLCCEISDIVEVLRPLSS